jgi:hypothetical protein
MADVQENTVGVVIEYTVLDDEGVALDISGATTKKLYFKKPNGVVISKDAEYVSDGSDGKLQFSTTAGDLSPYGKWSCQAYLVKSGLDGRTAKAEFSVLKNL